jgi:hypothetical protein
MPHPSGTNEKVSVTLTPNWQEDGGALQLLATVAGSLGGLARSGSIAESFAKIWKGSEKIASFFAKTLNKKFFSLDFMKLRGI